MTSPPPGFSGPLVVLGFLGFCALVALGTVLLTVYGQQTAPAEVEAPPEIGHELVPRR